MTIYVASSYRNKYQPEIIQLLRQLGHDVYDFHTNPYKFKWEEISMNLHKDWEPQFFADKLKNDTKVKNAFQYDYAAVTKADCCLVILPCGKSAHIEAGWFKGRGKKVYILMMEPNEPELMYKFFDEIVTSKKHLENIFGVSI
jgi:hypothetical protein